MREIALRKGAAAEHHRIHLRGTAPGDGEALVDRLDRDAVAIDLHPRQPLESDRAQQAIVVMETGAGVVIAGIDTEKQHAGEGGTRFGRG